MIAVKKIQTNMSWAAHVKKECQDGATQNLADACFPVIINDTCQLPDFVVNLSPIVTTLKHLKKCNYVDKPVGPNVSIALGGSIFSMRHLLAYGHRPGGTTGIRNFAASQRYGWRTARPLPSASRRQQVRLNRL